MTIIGYARVSTDGQTLDAQQAALKAAGAEKVFSEKVSGTVTDRKALGKALAALGQGDVLVVPVSIGSPGRPGTFSTCWRPLQSAEPGSGLSTINGRIRPRHMGSR